MWIMNAKAKKYVDMFRKVKIASAATVDEEGHPQTRIINVMIATDDGMYIVTSRGKPFYKPVSYTHLPDRVHRNRCCGWNI